MLKVNNYKKMSLNQELEDECENLGSQIILKPNTYEELNLASNDSSDIYHHFLRVGKPGKLFLQPNYTAFTKTNLGSIPSKIEKTLLKTEENIPITLTFNKNIHQNNKLKNEQLYKDPRTYTTSYSSKGYGVGFVSQVPRFNNVKKMISPGPGEYSPGKSLSLVNNINKSILGKSIFTDKTSRSLHLLTSNEKKFFTSQEIIKKLKDKYNDRYSKNLNNTPFINIDNNNNDNIINKEDKKGNYYFESKVQKFNGGLFNVNNKNPGPGKYFIDTNYKIKNKNQKSPGFMEPTKKKESPIKTYGLNYNDEKNLGYGLIDNKKNGKITTFWKGTPSLGFSYDFGKTLKKLKKNSNYSEYDINSNSNSVINIPDYDISRNLKRMGIMNIKGKDNLKEIENKNVSLSAEKYKFDYNRYKQDLIMKDLLKYRRKDFFGLSPPRWDEGQFHDNASHFQIPGPAYYTPKVQMLKRSFNLNKKDFIFTNSIPFKQKNIID